MKTFFILAFTTFIFTVNCSSQGKNIQINLMPIPYQYELTGGKFRIDKFFTVSVDGKEGERIFNAAKRMLYRLQERTGLFLTNPFVITEDESSLMKIETKRIGKRKTGRR